MAHKVGKTIQTIQLNQIYTLELDGYGQWRIFEEKVMVHHNNRSYIRRVPGMNNELCNIIGKALTAKAQHDHEQSPT